MHPAFGTRTVEYNPKIIFRVNILEALDNKITIPLIARYLGSLFTSNPKYADDNAETGGDRPVPVPRLDRADAGHTNCFTFVGQVGSDDPNKEADPRRRAEPLGRSSGAQRLSSEAERGTVSSSRTKRAAKPAF